MRATPLHWSGPTGWIRENSGAQPVDLVLHFSTREALARGVRYRELRAIDPGAHLGFFPMAKSLRTRRPVAARCTTRP